MPVPSPLHRQQVLLRGRKLLREPVPMQALLPQVQGPQQREPVDAVIAPADTRVTLLSALDILSGKRVSKLPKKHNNIPF